MLKKAKMCFFVALLAVLVVGCGGGGDGGGSGSTADTTRPTVSSINPANGSTNVPLNTGISAVFSEAMDYLTVTNATFTVSNSVGNISGAVSCSGTTATFTPSSTLGYNTTYTATITTAAKDSAGNALATNYSWTFTTGVAPDTTPPTVSSTSPASNATGVAVNSGITAAFSENMDSSTITTATFTLQQGVAPVSGTVTYSGTTATFTPSANLGDNTTYTATITTAAKDSAGNALSTNYSWAFTTGVTPDNTAPTNTTASNFINGGATVTALNSISLSISATDDVGVTAYYASETSTAPSTSDSGWTAITSTTSYSANVSYSPSSSGGATKTVYVWFKDASGNISASASDTITVVMGGSVQSAPLNLTSTNATVTTFAGSAGLTGSTDATGTAARFNMPIGLTTDGVNLYVADNSNRIIRKIVISTGVVTTIAGTPGVIGSTDGIGAAASFFGPGGMTTDGTNLFLGDNLTIRKIVIATGAVTTIAGIPGVGGSTDGTGAAARFNDTCGITTDGTNLFIADRLNYTIRKIVVATGAVTTLAGSAGIVGSTDGTGTTARFSLPHSITTDGTNLYVTDNGNNTIRKIVISTGVVTTLAGTAGTAGSTNGTGAAARFNSPVGITTDGSNLFVTEWVNQTVRKIVISTGVVTTIAGSPGISGSTDGTGSAARFYWPQNISTDGVNLFIADSGNHTIRKIQPTLLIGGAVQGAPLNLTNTVTTFAGSAGVTGSTDGTGTAARFNAAEGVTTDGTNLYVADYWNHTIRKIVLTTGTVTTLAGSAGLVGSSDGTGSAARFYFPTAIITDGTNIFVADNENHLIRRIVISTGVVTTVAGSAGLIGSTDGTGSAARFNFPSGITTDGTNLFVADAHNSTIRKIVISTGTVTTLAGSAGISGSSDGTGIGARVNYLRGITTDGTNLFVADTYNHTIRKIVISTGVVTTISGSAGLIGSTDGTGSAARFNYPWGITTDGANLFITDTSNQTIRKIVISTGTVTTIAGSAGVTGSTDGTGTAARFSNPWGITTDGTNLFLAENGNHTIRRIQ